MNSERDILVVDDEPVITQAVMKICGAEGMTVDAAEHGASGLALLRERTYRLIICDIMMTEVDGFQFLAEVVRKGISTPVVMVTGYATVENAVRSLACGAADFIGKPFTADELLAVVGRGLKYGRLQKEAAASAAPGRTVSLAYVPCPPKYYRLGYVSWAKVEFMGTVLVGLSDLFVKTVESLKEIDLLPADDELVLGGSCAVVTSSDGSKHPVMCPVSGRIVEVNAAVRADPAVVEKDPYFDGWLYRVVPADLQEDLQQLSTCSSDRL